MSPSFNIDNTLNRLSAIYDKYVGGHEGFIALGTAFLGGVVYFAIKELRDEVACKDFVKKYCGGNLPDKDVNRLCDDNGLRQIIYRHAKFTKFKQSDSSLRSGEAYFSTNLARRCQEVLRPVSIPHFQTEEEALRFDRGRNEAPFYKLYPATWGELEGVVLVPAAILMGGIILVAFAPALVSKPSFSYPNYNFPIGSGFYNHSSKELQIL